MIDSLHPGGAERYLATVVPVLTRANHAVSFVRVGTSRDADAGILDAVSASATDFAFVESTALYDPRFALELTRAARRFSVDVVHSHLNNSNTTSRVVATALGKPHVATIHTPPGPLSEDARRRTLADGATARLSTRIVGVSPQTAESYARAFRVPASRLRMIPAAPPLRSTSVGFDRSEMRRRLAGSDDVLLVCTLCRLRKGKGLDDLIFAAGKLREHLPALRVVIGGAGPDEERVRRMIDSADLGDVVRLIGHRDDVGDVLAAAEAFVLPSHHEGLPVSILEAMAAGVPCVATDVGGTRHVVQDGRTGLLVPPRAPDQLAAAIARILAPDGLAAQIAGEAARLVDASFTPAAIAEQHATLYRELQRSGRRS